MNKLYQLLKTALVATCFYLPAQAQDLSINPRFENECPAAMPCPRADGQGNIVAEGCIPSKYRIQTGYDVNPVVYPCSSPRCNIVSTHGFPKYVPNPYSNTNALANLECISNPISNPARVPRGQGIWKKYRAINSLNNYAGSYACVRVALGAWKFQPNTGTVIEVWSVRQQSQAQIIYERIGVDREPGCADWNSVINPDAANGFRIGTITEADLGTLNGYANSANPAFVKEFSFKIPNYGQFFQTIWIKILSTTPNDAVNPSYVQLQEVNVNVLCTAAEIANIAISPTRPTESQLPDRCFCGIRPGTSVEPPRNPLGGRMANPDAGETSADQTTLTGDIKVGIDPQTRKLSLQNAPSDLNIEEAKLYDLNGRTVLVSQGPIISMKQIDLCGIASGFYILTLKTSQGLVRTPIQF